MRVTVLGAGYMGSAMAKVAAARGHDVTLWGTWLDDAMLDPVARGGVHPKLGLPLSELRVLRADALAEALEGAELVVHGVSSEGAVPVMTKARAHLPDVPIVSVTKGFLELTGTKKMDRVDVAVAEAVGRPVRWVHASGPAKAKEIARGVLTWMCFAGADAEVCRGALGGDHVFVSTTDDLAGAMICSAMKNAYATGLGIWDGLLGADCHNARAACFQQSIVEMERLVTLGGGRRETAFGPAGVGDLHVTAAAGRNRAFGEGVGKGKPAKQVAAEMAAAGELTEGYPAIATARRWADERGAGALPLLDALHAIVWGGAEPRATLAALRLG